jgi:hypothetical protein
MQRYTFENCDRWFKSKISLLAYDEESGKERKTSMFSASKRCKGGFDNNGNHAKAQWVNIVFQLFRISYYGCFSLFSEKKKIWKNRKV